MRLITQIIGFLLLAGYSSTCAQTHSLTWRGAPLAKTKSFLITECGVSYRLFRSPDYVIDDNHAVHVEWELGWMRNTTPNWAFGVTGYFGADDNASVIAVKSRARRWLTPETALDFSAGPIIQTFGDYRDHAPGLAAGVTLMKGDLIGISLNYELTPYRYLITSPSDEPLGKSGTRHELYAGARFGSYAGTAVGIGIPIGLVLWIISAVDD